MTAGFRRMCTIAALWCACATLVAQSPQPSQQPEVATGIVTGRAVDGTTGKPLAGAIVTLDITPAQAAVTGTPTPANRPPSIRVITEGGGRFVFHDLPKGTIFLNVSKPGYAPSALGRNAPADNFTQGLALGESERKGDLTLKLWKYASLSGRVTDEAGEPVIGITVRLMKRVIVAGRPMFTQAGNMPTTDDRGIFRSGQLLPGDYVAAIVTTQTTVPTSLQDAYRDATKAGTSTEFSRELERSGGILMGLGQPASGQRYGSWVLASGSSGGLSNDRNPTGPPSQGGRVFVYPTTYYPTATTASKATVLTLESGEERLGVDFHLKPVVTSRVAGTLVGANGPESHTVLTLVPTSASDLQRDYDTANQTTTDNTGAFMFLGVTPGTYMIRALKAPPRPITQSTGFTSVVQVGSSTIYSGGGGSTAPPPLPPEPTFWAVQPVSVADNDVTGVIVAMRTGARLSGRLQFEGTAQQPDPDRLQQITVQIDQADGRTTSSGFTLTRGVVDTAGAFKTYELPPGRYLIRALGAPAGWTFKGATLNGRDVSDAPFDLGAESIGNIVVTFTDHPAELSGATRDAKGPDASATVLLFPTDRAFWADHGTSPRRFKLARVGTDGTFRFTSVPVGDYFIVSVSAVSTSAWLDPQFLQRLSAVATQVTIADGEKKSLNLDTRVIR